MCEDNANLREKALHAVVTAALTTHPGAQAVSVTPKVQGTMRWLSSRSWSMGR